MLDKKRKAPTIVPRNQLAQEAVAIALCLGFGSQSTQPLKKQPLQDVRLFLNDDGNNFWGE